MRFATSSAIVLVLACTAAPVGAEIWSEQSYNPAPASGDLSLPMPCGGAMIFRRVNVPSGGMLDDYKITLGSFDEARGYAEYRRDTWLAGGFAGEYGSGERHYYIGKYEVTRLQQAALGESCPDPQDPNGDYPATSLSWGEMVMFAERYSDWLVRNSADSLPTQDGAVGFLRLPTEAEWEFAARGGTAVSPGQFASDTFVPEGESLDAYVIHDGNSYRELDLIGNLKPNPLGIHDILGNAAEMVLPPFRLNVVSHLHGQAGGFVRRGGSFRTRPEEIRTSHREEYPPVDKHGVRRERTTGFRLVLVAPVLPSLESVEMTRTAWRAIQREPQTPQSPPTSAGGADDPAQEARKLAAAVSNEQMKRRLQELAFAVAESNHARNQERQRAARAALSGAVFVARWVMDDRKNIRTMTRYMDNAPSGRLRDRRWKRLVAARRKAAINLNHYIDLLTTMAEDYGGWELRQQGTVLEGMYADKGQETFRGLVQLVRKNIEAVRRSGPDAARAGVVESLDRRVSR